MARRPSKPKKEKIIAQPYFFKILIGDFTTKLRVPPAFVKNFKEILPTKVRLEYDYVGRPLLWNVKMKKNKSECYVTGGWQKIVRDLDLRVGDFLVFRLVNEETLEVVVFDRTCCEKKINIETKQDRELGDNRKGKVEEEEEEEEESSESHGGDSDEEEEGRGDDGCAPASPLSSSNKHYIVHEKRLVKHEMLYYILPPKVANEAEQWTKKSALIKGTDGRKWRVVIKVRTKGYCRLDFSTGWRKFIRDNNVCPGDTVRLVFKGGRDNLVEAQVPSRVSRSAN
ncbi:B3 domain-containing protein Os03g0212300-like [Punica granatum]|uniref:B3 domain-containing protein Os03g0212300-like n=2 Tax=Punica granatum TaxID=22663 RepID=A0A6P8CTA4_PUNGR|nr:B3 domain-containing protein Os03g0212300-like [Punica granatum]PKI48443.1 hypothetical protein CRG98_031169 [Punica granatum]